MSDKRLFETLSHVDERYLKEAESEVMKASEMRRPTGNRKKTKMSWPKIAGIAAAVAAVAAVGIFAVRMFKPIEKEYEGPYKIKHMQELTGDFDGTRQETVDCMVAPKWDEMDDCMRYCTLTWNGVEYVTRLIYVHPQNEGTPLGNEFVKGFDFYTDEVHEKEVEVLSIVGIDPEAAVAVRHDDGRPYAYANAYYIPGTLQDLMNALNIEGEMTTGLVSYADPARRGKSDVVYEDMPTEMLLEFLRVNKDAKLETTDPIDELPRMTVDVSIDLIGYHHVAFSFYESGYVMTNLLETGKYFYVGKEQVNEFVHNVTDNYTGYIYVFDSVGGPVGREEDVLGNGGGDDAVAVTGEEGIVEMTTAADTLASEGAAPLQTVEE